MSLGRLGKNTIIYAVGNVGARAAAFLLIPLYAHWLSVADFGLLATLQVTIQILAILMSVGMRTTLMRHAGQYASAGRLGVLLGTSTLINVLGGLLVGAAAFLLLAPIFRSILHTTDVYSYVALTCGAGLAQALSTHITAVYRARQSAVRYMISGLLTAALICSATILLVRVFDYGVGGALVAFALAHALIVIGVCIDILPRSGFAVSFSRIPEFVHFGLPLVFSMCSELVIGAIGVYLLGYFAGLEAVAIYSLGCKLAQILIITTISPFALAFEPYIYSDTERLNRQKEKIARSITYLILVAVAVSFCLTVAVRACLPWIAPPEYASAFIVVLVLLPGFVFVGIYYFGETLLNVTGKTRRVGLTASLVAVISVLLNYVLIRRVGWLGAALAMNASFVLMGGLLAGLGMRQFRIPLEWRRIGALGAVMLSYLAAVFVLRDYPIGRFTAIFALMGVLCVLLLTHYGFLHDDEKQLLRRLAGRWSGGYCRA